MHKLQDLGILISQMVKVMRGWDKSRRPLHNKHTFPSDKVAFVTAQHCLHPCIPYSKQRQQQILNTGLSYLHFSLPAWDKFHSLIEKGNGPSLNQKRWWEGGIMPSTTHNSSRFALSNKRVLSWITDLSPALSLWTCSGICLALVTCIGSDPDPDLWAYFPTLLCTSPHMGAWCPGLKIVLGCHPLSPPPSSPCFFTGGGGSRPWLVKALALPA